MRKSPIKVLLVEDSLIALKILEELLVSSPEIKVVGTAPNGKEALKQIPKVQPDLICTDLYMKEIDGLELTRQVMAKYPRPILVISNAVSQKDCQNTFKLLQAGALDVFPKPAEGTPAAYEKTKRQLIGKIKVLAGVSVFSRPKRQLMATASPRSLATRKASHASSAIPTNRKSRPRKSAKIKVVTIGASTGGPRALHEILRYLPKTFSVPIICTQHISVGFLSGLVNWLGLDCQLPIKIAEAGEMPSPGTVYFAPEQYHLELDSHGKFIYSVSEPVDGHCPSITVTFRAMASFYGRSTLGILLTGMGKDGATGLEEIAVAGGITVAQDEKSCVVFGMPKEAIALGAAQYILPIREITPWILKNLSA